jgi:hypothetical protein
MKKTLIAMAAVAVAGVASAQVSLTGTFNLDVDNKTSAPKATVAAGDVILSASAAEDLGGGMAVNVNTTFQTANGRGGKVTNNGYSMAVSGGFGTVTYKNYLAGSAGLSAGISAENDMNDAAGGYTARSRFEYALPKMVDGLTAAIRWDASNGADAQGQIDSTAFQTTKYAIGYTAGAVSVSTSGSNASGSKNDFTVSFDAGVAQVSAYSATGVTEFAVTAPVGALNVGFHMISGDNKANGLTASYALSKRTSLRYSYVNQSTVAAGNTAGAAGTNYRIRLGHSF